jgi:hypothetical protein
MNARNESQLSETIPKEVSAIPVVKKNNHKSIKELFRAKELKLNNSNELRLLREERLENKRRLELSWKAKREHYNLLGWAKEWIVENIIPSTVEEGDKNVTERPLLFYTPNFFTPAIFLPATLVPVQDSPLLFCSPVYYSHRPFFSPSTFHPCLFFTPVYFSPLSIFNPCMLFTPTYFLPSLLFHVISILKGGRKLLPPIRWSLKRKFGFKKDFKMGLG